MYFELRDQGTVPDNRSKEWSTLHTFRNRLLGFALGFLKGGRGRFLGESNDAVGRGSNYPLGWTVGQDPRPHALWRSLRAIQQIVDPKIHSERAIYPEKYRELQEWSRNSPEGSLLRQIFGEDVDE